MVGERWRSYLSPAAASALATLLPRDGDVGRLRRPGPPRRGRSHPACKKSDALLAPSAIAVV